MINLQQLNKEYPMLEGELLDELLSDRMTTEILDPKEMAFLCGYYDDLEKTFYGEPC